MSFLDGKPSVIDKCSKLRDLPVLCDDYFPSKDKQEAMEMTRIVKLLISLSFDKMTVSRSKSNGETRKNKRPYSMVIGTGELFPDIGASRKSRVLFINVEIDSINDDELKFIQIHQKELQYTMKSFLEDVTSNYEEIKRKIIERYNEKILEAKQQITHRTSEMITTIFVGFSLFMDFAVENGAINDNERNKMLEKGWNSLLELGKEQNKQVEDVSPTNMVVSAIELLSSTNKLFVVDSDSAPYMKKGDIFKQEFIGFYEKERNANFVYPELLYKKIRDFYRGQGVDFPFNQATVCKELMMKGFLYKTEKQERPQIRIKNPINQKEESTIGILADKIYIPCIYNERGTIKER